MKSKTKATRYIPFKNHESKPTNTKKEIGDLLQKKYQYNLTPDYQRDEAWKIEHEQELIHSIYRGISINAIHVNELNGNKYSFNVIDGKQRLTTIFKFCSNQFPIQIELSSGITKELRYDEIKRMSEFDSSSYDLSCEQFIKAFDQYQVEFNKYNNLSFEDEKELFRKLNINVKFNAEEEIYCDNYEIRSVMKFIWDDIFCPKINLLQKRIKDKRILGNTRFHSIRLVHEIMIVTFGKLLNETYQERSVNKKDLIAIADSSNKLEQIQGLKYPITSEEELKKILPISQIKTAVRLFVEIVKWENDEINNLGKIDTITIFDWITFILKNLIDNSIASNYIDVNKEKFAKSFIEYCLWKQDDQKATSNTKSKDRIKLRHDKIIEFTYANGIEYNASRKFSAKENEKSKILAAPYSLLSGERITEDNIQIDHPKSKNFTQDQLPVAMSKTDNRRKSDITVEEAEKISLNK